MININKPVRTKKDKWPARLLGQLRRGTNQFVWGVKKQDGFEVLLTTDEKGRQWEDIDSIFDLENVPEKIERWIVAVRVSSGYIYLHAYDSEDEAQRCNLFEKIAIFKITFEEGEGL